MAAVAQNDAKTAALAAPAEAPAVAAADGAAPADGAASPEADAEAVAAKAARQLEKKLKKEAQKKEQKEKKEKKAAAAAAASAKKKGESKEGMDVGKEEDFPRWYNQVITKSELIEFYDISVRCCRPSGWAGPLGGGRSIGGRRLGAFWQRGVDCWVLPHSVGAADRAMALRWDTALSALAA